MKPFLYAFAITLGVAGSLAIAYFNVVPEIQVGTLSILKVSQGGTGANTLSGCLEGNGTGPITGSGLPCGTGSGEGFSTTSADFWKGARNFFSTSSADYWETQQAPRGGGGGNISGWATSTTAWGQLVLYPTNGTEDVVFGRTGTGATTSAPFWWDVSATTSFIGTGGAGDSFTAYGSSTSWSTGLASSSLNFIIARAANLASNVALSIDSALKLTFGSASSTGGISATYLCLTSDCRTSWPTGGGGSGNVATSTTETAGQLAYWTSSGATPATLGQIATGTLAATSPLALTGSTIILGASRTLSLDTSGTWSGNAGTASALAANGSNCAAGQAAGGVTAAGVAEDCTDYWTEAENTSAAYISDGNTNWDNSYGFITAADDIQFSTTSANFWQGTRSFFSTTSNDYWKTQNNFFSTTSADYYKSVTNFFSTTSADYLFTQRSFFSTTSANYWETQQGSRNPFTVASNYNATNMATTSILWMQNGLNASSTSHFVDIEASSVTTRNPGNTFGSILYNGGLNLYDTNGNNTVILDTGFNGGTSGYFSLGASGFVLTDDGDGAMQIQGQGNGADEALVLNFDDTPDTITFTSWTGVSNLDFSGIAKSTFTNASTTRISADYASSTLYFGAGLANCNTENMLTWTDGRFGCESDTSGSGGGNISGWATSTTAWSQLILYPTNGSEDVAFGGTGTGATTTAPFWWDVSATTSYIGNGGSGDSFTSYGSSTAFSTGIASSSLNYIISRAQNLSSNVALTIDSALKLTFGNASSTAGISSSYFSTTNATTTSLTVSNLSAGSCDVKANNGVLYCGTDATGSGGLSAYDAWTHPALGISATTSTLWLAGLNASSTVLFDNATSTLFTATTAWLTNLFIGADTLAEYISDTAGAFFTGNTETGITVTYQDADNTVDVVCDTASGSVFGCLTSTDWNTFNGKLSGYDAWTHPQAGTSATSSGMIFSASSTIFTLTSVQSTSTNATTSNLYVTNAPTFSTLTSALLTTGAGGLLAEYAGSTCTNQAVTAISALGVATCTTLTPSYLDLTANYTWTGRHDFGGAVAEMPNGTAPVVDEPGEYALDTSAANGGQLLIATSTNASFPAVIPLEQPLFSVTIGSTTPEFISSGDILVGRWTGKARRITRFECAVQGGTSKVMSVTDGTNTTNSLTCGTTNTAAAASTNDTFTANELWYIRHGATTGAVNNVTFTAYGYISRE
jgi:hypothetical protein